MDVLRAAEAAGVQLVRFEYCDHSGVARAKTVHARELPRKLREGVGLTRAQMAINLLEQLQPVAGMEPVGEIRLVPDPDTFSVLPWDPRSASLLCDQLGHDGRDWGACPRSFLKRAVRRAEEMGIHIEATFENEFYLAKEVDGRPVPFDRSPVYSAIGLDLGAVVMHEIVDALEAQGLEVEQAINEYGPGQQEISIRHAPALRAADRQMKLRDTVRGVALRHGLLATFAPKPFPEEIGSGAHIHFSLWDLERRRNLLYDAGRPDGLSDLGRRFIGGILRHLRALAALTCPSYNSYRRLQPHAWSSAFTAWGFDNREAAVRVASPFWGREAQTYNVELKTSDASANPYLALGGLILSGLDGVERGLDPGEPVAVDPAHLPEEERRQRGIRPLPASQAEALAELERDEVLAGAMGDLLLRSYLAVRRSEAEAFAERDAEFEIAHHFYKF
ncbi:MAG: glutamine synthetase [Firmicutes bacterium]|nr:glutamine synthetase [Bacillota bacterium]